MNVTFLGTGTSHGVPSIDCMIDEHQRCKKDVCRLSVRDPKHARTRSSVLVEWEGLCILIDASLDFRQQALREQVKRIDAVLVTHGHADHIGGIPDLRSYTRLRDSPLPLYGSEESVAIVRRTFAYIFDPNAFEGGGIPKIQTLAVNEPFAIAGKTIVPIRVGHGRLDGCFGYRLGPLVYIPDMKTIAGDEISKCLGARALVLNCLREEREHVSHLILPESIALAREIGPEQCYLIHMCHDIHYEIDGTALETWMRFSYDGLRVENL